jgi:hypothetical protein
MNVRDSKVEEPLLEDRAYVKHLGGRRKARRKSKGPLRDERALLCGGAGQGGQLLNQASHSVSRLRLM